jgi:hypothetical protein
VFSRRDRVELGVLGLALLGWALIVAPAVHQQTHAHSTKHSHQSHSGPAKNDSHGEGSFEHQAIGFLSPTALSFTRLAVSQTEALIDEPHRVHRVAFRRVEQAQAP